MKETTLAAIEHVGFIGVGTMGKPMAKRLIDAGFEVAVIDVRESQVAELASHGAITPASYAELAEYAQAVILSLPNSQIVESVFYAPGDFLTLIHPGTVVIDMGTSNPASTRRIARALKLKQAEMLDAPVSGGEAGAIEGTLSCMVGGSKATLERVMPVLRVLANTINHIGHISMGHTMKLLNNMVGISNLVILCEVLSIAEKLGVDPEIARSVMAAGSASSKALDFWGERLIAKEYIVPTYRFDLAAKDVRLAQSMASGSGVPYPLFAVVHQLFTSATAVGLEKEDICAIKSLWDKLVQ